MAAFHRTIILLTILICTFLITCNTAQGPQEGDEGFHYDATTTTDQILNDIPYTTNEGKIAIVTGATSGLGRETVLALAQTKCRVIMAVRDVKKGEKVKLEIMKEAIRNLRDKGIGVKEISTYEMSKDIGVWELDLASLQSVLDFSKRYWREIHGKLDYLILNAGVMAVPTYHETIDGIEQQIGVNYLGHYYLMRLLTNKVVQKVRHGGLGRVISVSSRAHVYASQPISAAIDMMELSIRSSKKFRILGYEPWKYYGISKAFQILMARELQRREERRNILSVSCHPGVIKSGLQRFMTDEEIEAKTFDKNIKQGAATQFWLTVMPETQIELGGYYDDCQFHDDRLREDLRTPMDDFIDRIHEEGDEDEEIEKTNEYRLWEISEKMIEERGFTFDFTVRPVKKMKEEL